MILVALSIIAFGCVSTRSGTKGMPPLSAPALEAKLIEASDYVKKGCYVDIRKAVDIYRGLVSSPIASKARLPYAKTLILMVVKERDLGILNETYVQEAWRTINANRDLRFLVPFIELAASMDPRTQGIMKDIDGMATVQLMDRTLRDPEVDAGLLLRSRSDPILAYLYVTFRSEYALFLEKTGTEDLILPYCNLPLFIYKTATTYPELDAGRLKTLLASNPEFYEADYHLGLLSLGVDEPLLVEKGKADPYEAEAYFLKAQAGIPESPQIPAYLGGLCLFTEEYERAAAYFERALTLAPTFRDAILGKAICLGYQGEHTEAIGVLKSLVAMGLYLMGESHYWLAWNFHELGDDESARMNIEEAKKRLPTDSEVFCLSGTVALEQGDLEAAEKEFTSSLELNGRNLKAVMGLGRVCALKKDWLESAGFYAHAVAAAAQQGAELAAEIGRIDDTDLPATRKISQRQRKEEHLKILEETQAQASLEAAVGYLNGGEKSRALEMAQQALAHPAFSGAATRLIEKIKVPTPVRITGTRG